ncbi:MAG: hypothetical protein RJA81_1970 [Planctomycetota bacterium]
MTNEDLLVSYPEEWLLISGSIFQVESFITSFDSVNPWLINTPVNSQNMNLSPGMILQVVESQGTNPKSGVYVIETLETAGMVVRSIGRDSATGRGPGQIFAGNLLKATIFDFSPQLQKAASLASTVAPESLVLKEPALNRKFQETIGKLIMVRMANLSENARAAIGLADQSISDAENSLLEELHSDCLKILARNLGNQIRWTRIIR